MSSLNIHASGSLYVPVGKTAPATHPWRRVLRFTYIPQLRNRAVAFSKTADARYLRRLVDYTLGQPRLLAATIVTGTAGFLLAFVYPWLIGRAFNKVIVPQAVDGVAVTTAQRMHWLGILVVVGLITAVAQGIVVYCRGMSTVHLGHRIVTQLRRDLFDHFQRLSLHFYAKERTGSISARILHDVHGATSIIYGGFIVVFLDVAQLIIAVCLLVSINTRLAIGCVAVLPIYGITFRLFNPRVRKASEQLHHHYCKISGNVQEQLSGIALTKTYAAEDREHRRFSQDMLEHHDKVCHQSHIGHIVGFVSEILIHTGTMIVIGYGSYLCVTGQITPGDVTCALGYVGIMYGPVRRFAELNTVYQNSITAIRRVFRVFDITPKIADKPGAALRVMDRGDVRFENVKFRYQDDSDESRMSMDDPDHPVEKGPIVAPWVLNGIDFSIRSGQRIAFVGPSGSGKTTLVSLLPRLYDVGEGRITIDGIDIRDMSLKNLRSAIGIVQQDSFVFSGSVRENLTYGRPDATDDQVIAAAKAANAHEFISTMPQGYMTLLGERGVNLSGGQRQRLSIARAILKDPRILILDEATSALDTESERLVQDALETLMKGRTCFIIAHRLSTVRNADRILVLRAGKIAEQGRHEELLEQNGLYARLVKQQFGKTSAPVVEQDMPGVEVYNATTAQVAVAALAG